MRLPAVALYVTVKTMKYNKQTNININVTRLLVNLLTYTYVLVKVVTFSFMRNN